ncbi:MAG: Rid family hydrolase, partial [Candidatus Ratteibacteria bacterium]
TDIRAKISMDAYSIAGIKPEQIQFLSNSRYLSPTYIYGVTFERGVAINYRDRKHIFISGTASINRKGEIVHPGNVMKQLYRTLKNIEVLLKNAHAGFDDVCVFIIYVRDASDSKIVYEEMKKNFGNIPMQVVVASVCRPGWLVEIECQAICDAVNPDFFEF